MVKYRGKKAKYYEFGEEAKYWGGAQSTARLKASTMYWLAGPVGEWGNWRPRDNAAGWPPPLAPT